jgi:pyruvate/2-oxoglutarate dehydrogenase complex dihydrolipoamide acyltransferase (E2) component
MSRRSSSVRRRIAVATWSPSRDGRIFTRVTIDAGPMLAYVSDTRAATGVPVTMLHVVGAAVGRVLRAEPDVRARVVLGRIRPYPTCDVAFAVDIAGGDDLAPFTVREADTKSPLDIGRELASGADRLRGGTEHHHRRSSRITEWIPTMMMSPMLALTGFLVGGLGIGAFGQPAFPLGGALVSNVGSLGLTEAFLAPVPFARVPLYLSVGRVQDGVHVRDGSVAVRQEVVICATADHRLIDGAHAGRIATMLTDLLSDPTRLD